MNRSQQTELKEQTWAEAQKEIRKDGHKAGYGLFEPPTFSDPTAQWRWLAEQSAHAWQSVLSNYNNQWLRQLGQFSTNSLESNRNLNATWQFWMKQWQEFDQPWQQAWALTPWYWGQVTMGNGAKLAEVNKLYQDAYRRTFGRMLKTPQMGFNRELNVKLLNGYDAWVELQQAWADCQALLVKTWAQAGERFRQELLNLSQEGKTIEQMQDWMNLWFEAIDATFVDLYVSEEYMRVQDKLVRAEMNYRIRQRAIVEEFLEMVDLPTRSELDDAYRDLYELGKRVRTLEKALKKYERTAHSPAKLALAQSHRLPSEKAEENTPEVVAEAGADHSVEVSW